MKFCCLHACWRNISSTTTESHLLGKHKQGSSNNAYTKGKTWREQKTNKSSFWWIVATFMWNKLVRKKMTSSQPDSLDGWDFAYWQDQWLSSSLPNKPQKGLGFRLANQDHWCSAIWPITSSAECFLMNFHDPPPPPPHFSFVQVVALF
jgi:hypothetical protein